MRNETKLQIAFPKSKEDHRLQLIEINGSIFAVVHSPLESQGPVHLHCEDWSLVLLAPIKSKTNVLITGVNIICLNEIESEEGDVKLHASHRLVKWNHLIKAQGTISERGEHGKFELQDDPGIFLHYHRMFHEIVSHVRKETSDSFSQAQQKVMMNLCTLADKIEGGSENLDLYKVLDLWNVPPLEG